MLRAARHLVTPLGVVFPCFTNNPIPRWQCEVGVTLYDLFALKWQHRYLNPAALRDVCPLVHSQGLLGGHEYYDAEVDDARLVLRLLSEAAHQGATVLNYARVESLLRNRQGEVSGVALVDRTPGASRSAEVQAGVVINAAGPWSDQVRAHLGSPARLRKLRGSHLIFSRQRLPLVQAVTLLHPRDGRAMFVIPWETSTFIGTTDLDHPQALDDGEPFASQAEIDYMLEGLRAIFPAARITQADVVSTFAGVRPVVNTGAANPSKESRAHVVWQEDGMVTITGGKLTTFRVMAQAAVRAALLRLGNRRLDVKPRFFDPLPDFPATGGLPPDRLDFLAGRYGAAAPDLIAQAAPEELDLIPGTFNSWAEIRWNARYGAVVHLDDMLLRRLRLGLLLPNGGMSLLESLRAIIQPELGWDDQRWQQEAADYQRCWTAYYSPQPGGG